MVSLELYKYSNNWHDWKNTWTREICMWYNFSIWLDVEPRLLDVCTETSTLTTRAVKFYNQSKAKYHEHGIIYYINKKYTHAIVTLPWVLINIVMHTQYQTRLIRNCEDSSNYYRLRSNRIAFIILSVWTCPVVVMIEPLKDCKLSC